MELAERPAGDGTVMVNVAGKDLACLVCGNSTFRERTALLNTRLATFFKLDWANAAATTFICARCGFIHWFFPD
jgi:predicted nucleic-acid-binding Zn-ribbon protein